MKLSGIIIGLTCFLFFVPAASAEEVLGFDHKLDIDEVKTPLSIKDLLPEGGFAKVKIDTWLVTEIGENHFYAMHWSIREKGGKLVCEWQEGPVGRDWRSSKYKVVYDADGALVFFGMYYANNDRCVTRVWTDVTDKHVVFCSRQFDADDQPVSGVSRVKQPIERFHQAIPYPLMPLVLGYHARQGSLGYRFPICFLSSTEHYFGTIKVQDEGTERLMYDRAWHDAHFLRVLTIYTERNYDWCKLYADKEGNVFGMFTDGVGVRLSSQRMTAEQVQKQFLWTDEQMRGPTVEPPAGLE